MVGASKILTVSYGTFSCTLEGFDDSFGTMKAIAEYFRDLAADDRYFGAEPPSPDADMLQRIAEREIRNRVEARVNEDGIVLRAALPGKPAPQRNAVAPEAAKAATGDDSDSVAAKLARIRAVVENARTAAPAMAAEPDPFEISDAEEVEDDLAAAMEGTPDPKLPDPAAEAPEETPVETVAEAPAETAQDADTLEVPSADLLAALSAPREPEPVGAPRPRARVFKLKREDLAVHLPDPAAAGAGTHPTAPEDDRLPDALEADLQAELAALREEFKAPSEPEAVEPEAVEPEPVEPAPLADELDELDEQEAPGMLGATEFGHAEPAAAAAPETGIAEAPAAPAEEEETFPETAERRPESDAEQVEIALQRLWDETNTKLDGAEQKRRRASIAHLKAAVAATFADRNPERSIGSDDENERRPYRQVLAKVVRGNRDRTTPRPDETTRLAPLMLVSEQRVDATEGEMRASAETAIRPRRISPEGEETGPVDNIFAATTSFAEFAKERGAASMADTLEAAAAYILTIEGHESFSRPQVIRVAMSYLPEDARREEVLRAFGSLLRMGTFKKVRRGDFTMPGLEDHRIARRHA